MHMGLTPDGQRENLTHVRNVFDGGMVWADSERYWPPVQQAERVDVLGAAIGPESNITAVAKAAILAREVYGAGQPAPPVQSSALQLLAESGPAGVFPDLVYAFGPCFLGSKSLEIVAQELVKQDPTLLRALLQEGVDNPACLTQSKCRELLTNYEGSFDKGEAAEVAEYRQAMRRVVQSNEADEVQQYLEQLDRSDDCPRSSLTALMAVVLSPAFHAHTEAIVFCLHTFSKFVTRPIETTTTENDIQADDIPPIIRGFCPKENTAQLALLRLNLQLRNSSSA